MLEKEFKYYLEHQEELVREYEGKFIVIVDDNIKGVFDSEIEAYQSGKLEYGLGKFLIQQVLPGKDGYTQTFHSNVIFA